MNKLSLEIREAIAMSYDFSQFEKVVEFVNNENIISPSILNLYPKVKITLAVSHDILEEIKKTPEINDNFKITNFDFFHAIPEKSLLYLIYNLFVQVKQELIVKFLENLYKSTEVYTRLLIIDKFNDEKYFNSNWASNPYNELIKNAGFTVTNLILTGTEFKIIEVLRN